MYERLRQDKEDHSKKCVPFWMQAILERIVFLGLTCNIFPYVFDFHVLFIIIILGVNFSPVNRDHDFN